MAAKTIKINLGVGYFQHFDFWYFCATHGNGITKICLMVDLGVLCY